MGNDCSGLDKSDPASLKQGKLETGQPGMQLVQGEVGVQMPSLTHSRTLRKILFSLVEPLLPRIEVNGEDSEPHPWAPGYMRVFL